MKPLRLLALTFSITTLLVPFGTSAAVIISEVLPDPFGLDSEFEFVELHNNGSGTVDLSGWKLDDVLGGGSSPKTLAQGTLIQPGQYLAFFANVTRLIFNNTTDSVNLLDPNGAVMDSTSYIGDDNGKVKENYSWALVNGSWKWVAPASPNASNDSATPPPPAPATATTSTTPNQASTSSAGTGQANTTGEVNYLRGVFIHEILPNPEGDDSTLEFIELYNSNSYAIDLGSWKLDDAEGGSAPYTVPASTSIAAFGYLAFYSEDSRIALNNKGDDVRLFFPDSKTADSLTYGQSQEGMSYAKTDYGTWAWTDTPTPGQSNVITTATGGQTITTTSQQTIQIQQSLALSEKQSQALQPPVMPQPKSASPKPTTNQKLTANPPPAPHLSSPTSQLQTTNYQVPTTSVLASVQPFLSQPVPASQNQRPLIDFKSAVLISGALATIAVMLWRLKTKKHQLDG